VSARGSLTVVIADDSATVRAVVRRLLAEMDGVELVGEAADGEEAIERTCALRPTVLLLDLEMPGCDGAEVLARIGECCPTPVVVLSSHLEGGAAVSVVEALARGAVEAVPKPSTPSGWRGLRRPLERALRVAAQARAGAGRVAAGRSAPAGVSSGRVRLVAVGGSSGAPGALRELLLGLGAPPPVPVVVTQHIARGFDEALARWLRAAVGADVAVAAHGEIPEPGAVRIAPADAHLLVGRDGRLQLDRERGPHGGHVPSVDLLFRSCAESFGAATGAVLLSGMGRDGVAGMLAVREAGGLTVAQDEASCAVWGMPRAAVEAGAAERQLPPRAAGELLRAAAGEPGRRR